MENVMEATENVAVEPDTTVDTEPMDDTMDSPGTGILKKIVIGAIATGIGAGAASCSGLPAGVPERPPAVSAF